jgi:hypothetical protein
MSRGYALTMLKNGGFRLVAAALIVGLLGFALPASSIFQSPAVETIDASSTKGDQLMVCVDWTTKEIKYSKNWETCPSKHQNIMLGLEGPQGETGAQGPRGYSGSSGSSTTMWNSLSTCYQKLQVALQAGFIMPLKTDRDFFEASTGCIVEDVRADGKVAIAESMGVPYISDWALIPVSLRGGGDGFLVNTLEFADVKYRITIANQDALSAANGDYRFCLYDENEPYARNVSSAGGAFVTRWSNDLMHLGGNLYENEFVSLRADPYAFRASITLGFKSSEISSSCSPISYWRLGAADDVTATYQSFVGGHPVYDYSLDYPYEQDFIHEDPAAWVGSSAFSDHLDYWGW